MCFTQSYKCKYHLNNHNMKKVKLVLVAVALTVSSLSFASEKNPSTSTKKELQKEIVTILGSQIEKVGDKTVKAEISLTLNSKSEIVILSVKSKNEKLEGIVKSKLNYKKVKVKTVKEGEVFVLPLKVVNK